MASAVLTGSVCRPEGQVRPDTGIGHEGEVLVEVPRGDRVELEASGEQVGSGVAPKASRRWARMGSTPPGDGIGGGAVRSIAMP